MLTTDCLAYWAVNLSKLRKNRETNPWEWTDVWYRSTTVSKWFTSFSVGQGYSARPPIKVFFTLQHGENHWSHSSSDRKTIDLLERIVSKFALSAVKEISFLRLSANGTDSYRILYNFVTFETKSLQYSLSWDLKRRSSFSSMLGS